MRTAQERLTALWTRSIWGKIAVGLLAVVLLCCSCTALGLVVNVVNPRAAAVPTSAPEPTAAPAAELATAAPEPTSAPEPTPIPPEPTTVPTAVPSATPEPPTAVPATATPAPPTAVPATAAPVRERGVMMREDLGDKWPLTVDAIRLRCLPGRVLVFDANGTTYALNGTAKSKKLYADVAPIWLDDPRAAGLKISLGPLLDAGLALCG